MKTTKRVEFNKTDIENETKDALIKLAAKIIGEPNEGEEYVFELCSWRHEATVEIVKKSTVKERAEEPNAQVAEPMRSVLTDLTDAVKAALPNMGL